MKSLMIKNILFVFVLMPVLFSFSSAHANCSYYEESLPKIEEDILSLRSSVDFLGALLQGRLHDPKDLNTIFTVPVDKQTKIAPAIQLLENRLTSLRTPLPMSDELSACAERGLAWLNLSNERRKTESALLEQKIRFLKKPLSIRAFMLEQIKMRRQVQVVAEAISLKRDAFSQKDDLLIELDSLKQWIESYQDGFDGWLKLYIAQEQDFSLIDQYWLKVMTLPSPRSNIVDLDLFLEADAQSADWLDLMSESRSALIKDVSKWRNQALLTQGWVAFFSQTASPLIFFEGLFKEVISAPKNFLDNLSRPFIKEYKLAAKEDKQITLLLSWLSQVLALIMLCFMLIKMAGSITSWLAKIQQELIAKVQTPSLNSLFNGVFWALKPNASWVFILLAANTLAHLFKNSWQILGLIAPIGTIYAVFRGLRVIIEWGLTRIHTRSELFLSSQAAEQLGADSQNIAWILLACIFFWWLAYGTGGGYSIYLISLIDIVVLWLVCLWLLNRYRLPVNKVTESVLNIKLSGDNANVGVGLKFLLKAAWPLVFLAVHIIDVLYSLNQKMMVFDVYRSLSVKLLRVRLESSAEDTIEDDTEPDQNYTEWMLREVEEDSFLDVGDVSVAIDPIDKWYSDKTDENVTVVVGEPGSGKTTFVRRLPELLNEIPVKVFDVPAKTTNAESFYNKISVLLEIEPVKDANGLVDQNETIEKQVLVIDEAHNLFIAEVGFFNAYRALMECMNAHLTNVYWVVVVNAPSWVYLSYVFSREQKVSNLFKMPRWSPMDIRKLILSRHKGSQRRLKYNKLLFSAAASSESSSIRAADSRVFNILWEQAGGNPLAAIELWLQAMKVKGRLAEVGVPERPSANLLNDMKDDLHFVYTAIVLHGSLSIKEIMLVTHFYEPIVRHAVKQGINMGMIIRDESMRYKIDPYWYGSLSGVLHRKNLLWS